MTRNTPDDLPADQQDLLRRFKEQLETMSHEELHAAIGSLLSLGSGLVEPQPTETRRAPRRGDTVTYVVRVDLKGAKPPLWRRLELASDLYLNELHEVIQIAFGWQDQHLHRFASGPSVFSRRAELFLCPADVEDGDEGIPEDDVRIDEVLTTPGSILHYLYDYGDCWEHTIKLERITTRTEGDSRARCVSGRRPNAPEDCGGVDQYNRIAAQLPPHDVTEINTDLDSIFADSGAPPLVQRLLASVPHDSRRLIGQLIADAQLDSTLAVSEEAAASAVHRFRWMLQRASEGITLTSQGHLPPTFVQEAIRDLNYDVHEAGKGRRESDVGPLLYLRESMQELGLVRKNKGMLVATRRGRQLADDPVGLWNFLAETAPAEPSDAVEQQACTLLLLSIAAQQDDPSESALEAAAEWLTYLGWRNEDEPLYDTDAAYLARPLYLLLIHLRVLPSTLSRDCLASSTAAAFARAVLRTSV